MNLVSDPTVCQLPKQLYSEFLNTRNNLIVPSTRRRGADYYQIRNQLNYPKRQHRRWITKQTYHPQKGTHCSYHIKTENKQGWEMARCVKCLLPKREDLSLGAHGVCSLHTSPSTGDSETRGSLSSRFGERYGFKTKASEMARWVKAPAMPETDAQNPHKNGWRRLTSKSRPLTATHNTPSIHYTHIIINKVGR